MRMSVWIIRLRKWIEITIVILGALSNVVDPCLTKPSKIKVCDGEDRPFAMRSKEERYAYKTSVSKYANCTHIVNHLSLFNLKATDNIMFLSSIIEVGGSVFIGDNTVREIPLSNLRVIYGHECGYNKSSYSLYIANNKAPSGQPAYLNLRSLVKIKRCNVLIEANKGFCNLNAIENAKNELFDRDDQIIKFTRGSVTCPVNQTCSRKCGSKNVCYGPGPDMCRLVPKFTERCPSECLGGCLEPTNTKCLACRNYLDGEECVKNCPTSKFLHFTACVDTCPKRYLISRRECVENCPKGTYPNKGRCKRCETPSCEGACRLSYDIKGMPRSTLKKLKNCTIVDGNIVITSLSNDPLKNENERIKAEDFKNLENVRHINGFLSLNLISYPNIKNLSFLSNLETVNAPKPKRGIEISNSAELQFLGLTKL